ncbi:hypothetical protein [Hwanghaeella sp.]|uniref:hypothetical protein n=1 Tax=Hwanghaeella sp. TaxID=2605943 RepID=UPI003CCB9D3A
MALTGDAFLAIWHDIEPSGQTEYMEWHTREHMPERLSIPGFTVGKRLINHSISRYRYGTIYSGETVEVFRSPAYLERLNNPTDWSNKVQPTFRNFLRVACDRIASAGVGEGGAMATIRLDFQDGAGADDVKAGAQALVDDLLGVTAACGVHLGLARTEVSGVKTRETELRPDMKEKEFDALVLIEGSGLPELEASVPLYLQAIADSSCGLGDPAVIVYNLAYQLTAEDMGQ